jgi:hypothetical protein
MKRACLAVCLGLAAGSCSLLNTGSPPTASSVVQQDADAQAPAPTPVQPALSEERETRCEKEAKCLTDLHGIASRNGNALNLRLDNGSTKTFRSSKPCEEAGETCDVTTLVGYMPPQHMFVLRRDGYESVRYLVVSGQNGKSFELEAEPHLAPDGKQFVVVGADEMNGWERDVAIFSASSFPPKLEWGYRTQPPDEYATYAFAGWDGNGRIKLRATGAQNAQTETDVRHTAEGWKLRLTNGEFRTGIPAARQNQRRAADRPS